LVIIRLPVKHGNQWWVKETRHLAPPRFLILKKRNIPSTSNRVLGYFFNYSSISNALKPLVECPERLKHKFVSKFFGCRSFGKLAATPGKNPGGSHAGKHSHQLCSYGNINRQNGPNVDTDGLQ
jgi:hypothetical protein